MAARGSRTPRKKAAKALKESLLGSDKGTIGSFHLAHSGVRGIVKKLEPVGISPSCCALTFTLIENVGRQTVPYMGRGLNTNIQVAEESTLNVTRYPTTRTSTRSEMMLRHRGLESGQLQPERGRQEPPVLAAVAADRRERAPVP